jgi:DNA-directed RNA polymerase specialized sigma24 family protein
VLRAIIRNVLGPESDESKIILLMHNAGFTHCEIADYLGDAATERSVEGKLRRARARIAHRHDEGGDHADGPGLR